MTDVNEILTKYLEENGFDGLWLPGECACLIDDLQPCAGIQGSCRPGYRRKPTEDDEWFGEADWVLSDVKTEGVGLDLCAEQNEKLKLTIEAILIVLHDLGKHSTECKDCEVCKAVERYRRALYAEETEDKD